MPNQEKREALLGELRQSIEGPRGPIPAWDVSEIARALGATEVIPVSGPLEALFVYHRRQLAHQHEYLVKHERANQRLAADVTEHLVPRLESGGGRPTVPEWELARATGYAPRTWAQLQEVAELASTDERKVSPSHIASYLIERALHDFET